MPPLTTAFMQDAEAMQAEVTLLERISDLLVVTCVTLDDVLSRDRAWTNATWVAEQKLMQQMGLPTQFRSSSKDLHTDTSLPTGAKMHHLPAPHPKYWRQRYLLFSKFDDGVQMDDEGWYSVTPEAIANHHAKRCASALACDLFAGVGGNAIALANTCGRVLAIDHNRGRLDMAIHNAEVYGVSERLEFVCGESISLLSNLKADVIFLSPPWGGIDYSRGGKEFSLTDINVAGIDGIELLKRCLAITPHVAVFLPRNTSVEELAMFTEEVGIPCEVEQNWIPPVRGHPKMKAITVYFGKLAQLSMSS